MALVEPYACLLAQTLQDLVAAEDFAFAHDFPPARAGDRSAVIRISTAINQTLPRREILE
jgi:hypothetical protein